MDNLENQGKAEALYKQLSSSNSISEDTAQAYEKCLELNPNHILALWDVGRIYAGDYDRSGYGSYWDEFRCGNRERAKYCFTKIIEIDPKFSQAYNRLGRIYLGQDNEKAIKYFLQYINLNSEDYQVIAQIASIYYLLNKKQEAIAYFTKCIKHNQKDSKALQGLANIYEDQGNFKGALQCLKKCIEIYDKSAVTHAHVGRVYDKMGNIKEAINSYRKCNHLRYDLKQAQDYLKKHLNKDLKH